MTLIDESDLGAKGRQALGRFRLECVRDAAGPAFSEAYGALAAEFAPRGELERREVIAGWLRRASYYLLVARDEDGRLAGVRDCHVVVGHARNAVVVYLAHVLVLPAHRRS